MLPRMRCSRVIVPVMSACKRSPYFFGRSFLAGDPFARVNPHPGPRRVLLSVGNLNDYIGVVVCLLRACLRVLSLEPLVGAQPTLDCCRRLGKSASSSQMCPEALPGGNALADEYP